MEHFGKTGTEKKVKQSPPGYGILFPCEMMKRQGNKQAGMPGRDRRSICQLFSRQPRERFSSAALITLSQPEGSSVGSLESQWKKARYMKLTLDVHSLVTVYWSLSCLRNALLCSGENIQMCTITS